MKRKVFNIDLKFLFCVISIRRFTIFYRSTWENSEETHTLQWIETLLLDKRNGKQMDYSSSQAIDCESTKKYCVEIPLVPQINKRWCEAL